MSKGRAFAGECLGTFIMCFTGIGAVATATLYGSLTGPGQVGLVWGLAIAIAIYATRDLSAAHFNPAVTIAMCVSGRMKWREFPIYLLGQCVGAFVAAGALWGLFSGSVAKNLASTGLSMASNTAGAAASIWCEVFPNTTAGVVSAPVAAFAEGIGVFVLVLVIFSMTSDENVGRPCCSIAPFAIGLTITILINVIGPLTDAGLNPARDIMPRVWAACVGWGSIAFGTNAFETICVYVVGPIVGGIVAALLYTKVLQPMHEHSKSEQESCDCGDDLAEEEKREGISA